MIKQPKQKRNGFSLIEIIIVISISVLLFLIVSMVYYISQITYQKTDTRAEITQNSRVITDRMVRELRQSQSLVTTLPADNSNPALTPSEIKFLDGHNSSIISYIRYYLAGQNIQREYSRYYFPADPTTYVHIYDTDQYGNPPIQEIVEDKIIGEHASDLEFYGNKLININLYLIKNSETIIINTSIYGRNL
ncbi:MAG: prepilin-type N-terminal cleavage/methylation domain-containing protein [Patescibacteria group bacterium]